MDRNLKAFLTIADMENLTEAARRLGLTQPSITKRLHNLEQELGGPLFIRHRRGMTLTASGKQFYRRAKKIEQEYLQAGEELKSLRRIGLDVLRIGAGPLFNLRYVATVFSKLHSEFPFLQLSLIADNNQVTLPLLIEGELDIVLGVLDHAANDSGLQAIPLTVVEQGVMLKTANVRDEDKHLAREDLRALSWILYSDDKSNEEGLTRYFAENDLGAPAIAVRTSSFTTGMNLVQSGDFAMMAPTQLRPVVNATGLTIVPVDPPISRRPAGVYVRQSSTGFAAVSRFVELLEAEIEHTVAG